MAPFSKEDEVLIKMLYEQKGHNARQFMTSFGTKDGQRVVATGC